MTKKNKVRLVVGVVALVIAIIAVRCFQRDAHSGHTIKIGAALNLTGAAAEYGKCGMDAIKVIESQLSDLCDTNKVSVQFFIEDTGSTAKGTINAYNAIRLKAPDCKIVLTQGSAMGAAISDFTKRDGVIQFSAGAFSTPVANNPYFYVNISDEMMVARMFLTHTQSANFGLAFHIDDDFGNSVCSILNSEVPGRFQGIPFSHDTDMRSLVAKTDWKRADVVLLIGWGPNMLNLIRGLREAGYANTILSTAELQSEANKRALESMSKNILCMSYSRPPESVMDVYWKVLRKKDLYISDINIYNASVLSIKAASAVLDGNGMISNAQEIKEMMERPEILAQVPCIIGIEKQRVLYKMEFQPL